jgi:DnaK suppressor protein
MDFPSSATTTENRSVRHQAKPPKPVPTDLPSLIKQVKSQLTKRSEALVPTINPAEVLNESDGEIYSSSRRPALQCEVTSTLLLGHASKELRAIHAALERINNGTYGYCIDCGQLIPLMRLASNPTANRCVGCQLEHEKPIEVD